MLWNYVLLSIEWDSACAEPKMTNPQPFNFSLVNTDDLLLEFVIYFTRYPHLSFMNMVLNSIMLKGTKEHQIEKKNEEKKNVKHEN